VWLFQDTGVIQFSLSYSRVGSERGVSDYVGGKFWTSVGLGSSKKKIPAIVIMPEEVPKDRIKIISDMGAQVILKPRLSLQDAVDQLMEEAKQNGKPISYAHPFDDLRLIAGHGSCGLEIIEDIPDVEVIVAGIGGGGYISGIAVAAKGRLGDKVKVIGVEPEGANAMYLSLKEGKPVKLSKINTIVAGLAAPFAGVHCYEHVKRYVDDVVLVSDEEVVQAMKVLYDVFKLVVEPAAAAGFAALMLGKLNEYTKGKKFVSS